MDGSSSSSSEDEGGNEGRNMQPQIEIEVDNLINIIYFILSLRCMATKLVLDTAAILFDYCGSESHHQDSGRRASTLNSRACISSLEST
jgi:hypothetical protein